MNNCVFCEILAGNLAVSPVYRDELCTAFMDIQPVNPGHVLVIPNEHATFLSELNEETGAHMFRVAQRIAQAIRRSGIKREGINLFLADGAAAMQEIFHVHLHVIPRYAGDGFGLTFGPEYSQKPSRAKLDAIAQNIRVALEG